MDMHEVARLIIGLRSGGLTAKQINDLLLYIESGDEKYLPESDEQE